LANRRRADFEEWYLENRHRFAELADAVKAIIIAALRDEHIPYLSITSRAKTIESAINKIRGKGYQVPQTEMTDLAGVRVLTYTQTDADRVCDLLKTLFSVDAKRTVDKSAALKRNKVGYRSFHLVCELPQTRCELVEFKPFKGCVFEIQVRTVLQHAWAEIEHSRNYKFGGVLPQNLERKLNLIAGLLEVADNEISQLAKSIDEYRADIARKTKRGDLQLELTTDTLDAFVRGTQKKFKKARIYVYNRKNFLELIEEAKKFGIKTIEDLNNLLSADFVRAYDAERVMTTESGFIRDLMMFEDLEGYFAKAHDDSWHATDSSTYEFLLQKYSARKVDEVFKRHEISVDEYARFEPDQALNHDVADPSTVASETR
jgi:putative GTP pyrophosphokinase